jgi:hypothetical protein
MAVCIPPASFFAGGLGPELRAADEALGRLELLTPVRIKSNDQAEELGSAMVLTQVTNCWQARNEMKGCLGILLL